MLCDRHGCTSVSLAALRVLGTTSDEAMRVLYKCADCEFLPDSEQTREDQAGAHAALKGMPLRDPVRFEPTGREGRYVQMRPIEVSSEDVERALEHVHGPGAYSWTLHTGRSKWWKDTRGKYVVAELNTGPILPGEMAFLFDRWREEEDTMSSEYVIAVSGARFYCRDIKAWLPCKYLWLTSSGKPVRDRHGVKGIFTRIHSVYKVQIL